MFQLNAAVSKHDNVIDHYLFKYKYDLVTNWRQVQGYKLLLVICMNQNV